MSKPKTRRAALSRLRLRRRRRRQLRVGVGLKVITSPPSPAHPSLTVSFPCTQLLRESASSGSIGNSLQIVARFYWLFLLFMALPRCCCCCSCSVAVVVVCSLACESFLVINQFLRLRLPFRSARKRKSFAAWQFRNRNKRRTNNTKTHDGTMLIIKVPPARLPLIYFLLFIWLFIYPFFWFCFLLFFILFLFFHLMLHFVDPHGVARRVKCTTTC